MYDPCLIPVFITFINKKNEITFPSTPFFPPPQPSIFIHQQSNLRHSHDCALKVGDYVLSKMKPFGLVLSRYNGYLTPDRNINTTEQDTCYQNKAMIFSPILAVTEKIIITFYQGVNLNPKSQQELLQTL